MPEVVDHILIGRDGAPVDALAELMVKFDLDPAHDIDQVDAQLQKHWLAHEAKFRYEIRPDGKHEALIPAIWEAAEAIGLTQERQPSQQSYKFVLMGGALMTAVHKRLQFVLDQGLSGQNPVALASKRSLIQREKDYMHNDLGIDELLPAFPHEGDGFQAVMGKLQMQGALSLSEDRPKDGESGDMRPANLGETVQDWYEAQLASTGWEDGNIALAYSSPFFASGALQASLNIPEGDTVIEPIGPGISEVMRGNPAAILDEIAKAWRNEQKRVRAGVGNVAKIVW